jgi:hypothetical protein
MDEILDIGYGSNDPKDWPRDGIYFEVPLSVDIEELRVFSQFIDVLGIDPKFADKLALQLPRFPN